jgi:tetratricopeptide (TPR) repeat protein
MTTRILSLLLVAGMATACVHTASSAGAASAYDRGRARFEGKDYRGAVEAFEQAQRAAPDDPEIAESLAAARAAVAAELVSRARTWPPDDLWMQFNDLDEALSLAPSNAQAKAAFDEVWQAENSLQQNLARVYAELNASHPGKAYDLFKPLARFKQYKRQFRDTEELILQELKGDNDNHAITELAAGRPAEARKHLDEALQLDSKDSRAKAVVLALGGNDQLGKKDYRAALATFRQSLALFPDFTYAQQRAAMARRGVVSGILAEQMSAYQRAKDAVAVVKTLNAHNEALTLADQGDPERAELDKRVNDLRIRLTSNYLNVAVKAAGQGPQYAATVLSALRAAHLLNPDSTMPYEQLAARALKAVQDRTRLNVALHFQGTDREADQLAAFLHESAVAAIDKSGLSGISVVTREHLRDLVLDEESLSQGYSSKQGKGIDLATADVILLGSVVRNRVTETGRTHPNRKGSKYISGSRDVRNPAYGQAQAALHDAEAKFRQAEANYEQQSPPAPPSATPTCSRRGRNKPRPKPGWTAPRRPSRRTSSRRTSTRSSTSRWKPICASASN